MENKGIASIWYYNIEGDKEEFKQYLHSMSSNACFVRLKEIVTNKRLSLEASERNPEIYKDTSWAYLQAHNNGARQSLKFIEDLLSFVK